MPRLDSNKSLAAKKLNNVYSVILKLVAIFGYNWDIAWGMWDIPHDNIHD